MKTKHIIISIIAHVFLILFLIYFSWSPSKKVNEIQPIEMVNIENPKTSKTIPEKKTKLEAEIPKPKEKNNIVVPKKKIIKKRKIIKKPEPKKIIKPLPKIEPTLEEKLKELEKDVLKPDQEKKPIKDLPESKKKILTTEESES